MFPGRLLLGVLEGLFRDFAGVSEGRSTSTGSREVAHQMEKEGKKNNSRPVVLREGEHKNISSSPVFPIPSLTVHSTQGSLSRCGLGQHLLQSSGNLSCWSDFTVWLTRLAGLPWTDFVSSAWLCIPRSFGIFL